METNRINGTEISERILSTLCEEGVSAHIRVIVVAPNAATQSYLRIKRRAAEKAGMVLDIQEFPTDTTTETVLEVVKAPGAEAIIVQLPLPVHLDEELILSAISARLDPDVLSVDARTQKLVVPPVAAAVEEILTTAGVNPVGKRVVVIGNGRLVGAPVTARLTELGATVTVYDEYSFTPEVLKDAEIVVSGAGVPGLVQPEMLSDGVVLIDAGTSEQGGVLAGDIDPACRVKASVYTPVPGGVGPITVACLMRNIAFLRAFDEGGAGA